MDDEIGFPKLKSIEFGNYAFRNERYLTIRSVNHSYELIYKIFLFFNPLSLVATVLGTPFLFSLVVTISHILDNRSSQY